MEFHLPLYAVQRLADGTWLVQAFGKQRPLLLLSYS